MEHARTQIKGTAARVTDVEHNEADGTANTSNDTIKVEHHECTRSSAMCRSSQVAALNTKTAS